MDITYEFSDDVENDHIDVEDEVLEGGEIEEDILDKHEKEDIIDILDKNEEDDMIDILDENEEGELLSDSDLIRVLLDQNVEKQHLLGDSKVDWSVPDEIGNSDCILKDDAKFKVLDKSDGSINEYTGKEFKKHMKRMYGQDYVSYSHKEPDFSPFEKELNKEEFEEFLFEKHGERINVNEMPESHIILDHMGTNRKDTYGAANNYCIDKMGDSVSQEDLEDFMKQNNLTWHECGDRKTMQMIPSEINQIFRHTGGIGVEKDFETLKKVMEDISRDEEGEIHPLVLNREKKGGEVSGFESAIERRYESNKKIKEELF